MGTCQYKNLNGEHTCNIDTELFKDNGQEDLFPDFCYFHQIGEMFNYFYLILKDKNADINFIASRDNTNILNNKVQQILLFLLCIPANLPKQEIFYANFHTLMNNNIGDINVSGFYFPGTLNSDNNIAITINNSNKQIVWNKNIIWNEIKGYNFADITNNIIRNIILSQVFKPIIRKSLTQFSSIDFYNLFEDELIKHISYDNNINIATIFESTNTNTTLKDIISKIIKDMNLKEACRYDYQADKSTLAKITSIIQKTEKSNIVQDDDINAVNYLEIRSKNIQPFINNFEAYKQGLLSGGTGVPRIEFQNMIFNHDIIIKRGREYPYNNYNNYLFEYCEFNSSKIVIQANELEISKSTMTNKVKNIELSVPFRNLELSKTFSDKQPLFEEITNVHIYDGYDVYKDSIQHDIVGEPNKGLFQYVNLKNVLLHSCNKKEDNRKNHYENLNKLRFVHCEFHDGHKLYEDTNFYTFPEEQRAGILKRLEYNYRYLRKHFDEKGDYIEGNDFHYNYMEAKRNNTENAWDRFLLGLYEGLNGYNTKPEKTFWILVLLVLTSSLVIFCLGEFDIKDSTIYTSKDNHHYAFSLLYAFSNLVPLINSDLFVPKNWISVLVKLVENISSPILVTFFVMALRNRFRRSKSEDEFK